MKTLKYKPHFITDSKTFLKGWYYFDQNGSVYRFVCRNSVANNNKINNSNFMLELFNELPENATLNNKK